MRNGAAIVLSLSLVGCAAVFRGKSDTINLDSTPTGAEAQAAGRPVGPTPTQLSVDRKKSTEITLTKPGYETATVVPKRHINAAWLTLDLLTCIFPVALCIPLLVDGVSGRWYDVDNYHATLKPGTTPTPGSATAAPPPPPPTTAVASAAPAGPPPDMSESERKATARAAYMEGIKLQEGGNCPEALGRFEVAQRYFSAPTHLLHLGQCQAATGKLVEASESYETLSRVSLAKDAPDAFRQAQEEGKKALATIRPRIPTLKLQLVPPPTSLTSLVVKANGNTIPNEVLAIARPVNPGRYKIMVWAAGYRETSVDVEVPEGGAKVVELKLAK